MRQGPNGRRPRSRHNSNGGGGNGGGNHSGGHSGGVNSGGHGGGGNRSRSAASLRHQSFDSNCGDLRVRGNAWQVHEKYQALGRDAASGGDRVAAENYQQHAEHYFRIIEAINEATAAEQTQRGGPGPTQAYGQQPEVPRHYYNQDGTLAAAPPGARPDDSADSNGNTTQPPRIEATVQQRNPPPSPFFTPEEIEEHHGEQPLTAIR